MEQESNLFVSRGHLQWHHWAWDGGGGGGVVVHAAAAVSTVGSSGAELSPVNVWVFPSGTPSSSHSPKQED